MYPHDEGLRVIWDALQHFDHEVVDVLDDELVIEVLQRTSINPKFLLSRVTNADAREALAYQNPQAARWL